MMTIIFSCMNRNENLIRSIESWVDSHNFIKEIIVVDWSSKKPLIENDYLKKLVIEKKIKIIRVDNEKYFSLAKSYNLAASNASSKIILKLDADYVLKDRRWMDHIQNQVLGIEGISNNGKLSEYFIRGDHMFSLCYTGFLLINKENFLMYNENMEGYGHDDIELYERTKKQFVNLKEIIFFNIKDYIYHISHSDEERGENYKNKDIKKTSINNSLVNEKFIFSKYKEKVKDGNFSVLERIVN